MPQSRKSVSSRSASRSASRPQWAERVEHLRRGMKYSQSAMGKKLGFSAMAISRWERGVQEPPSKSYIQLGNMAGDPKCWYFWGRAGLHSGDVIRVLPEAKPERHGFFAPGFDIVTAGSGPLRISSVRTKLVAIPLLKVHAGAHGHKGDKSQNLHDLPATDAIAAPSAWCPHPSKTTCLRVRGDSMMPLIHDDYVLAVDTFEGVTNSTTKSLWPGTRVKGSRFRDYSALIIRTFWYLKIHDMNPSASAEIAAGTWWAKCCGGSAKLTEEITQTSAYP